MEFHLKIPEVDRLSVCSRGRWAKKNGKTPIAVEEKNLGSFASFLEKLYLDELLLRDLECSHPLERRCAESIPFLRRLATCSPGGSTGKVNNNMITI